MNTCCPFEVLVNLEALSLSERASVRRLRVGRGKRRGVLASILRFADSEATEGDGERDDARSKGGPMELSSSSSVEEPASSIATC